MNSTIIFASSIILAIILSLFAFLIKPKKDLLPFRVREDKNKMFYFIMKILAFFVFVLFIYRNNNIEEFEYIVNKDRLFSETMVVRMVVYRTLLGGAIFMILVSPWFNYRPFQNAVAVFGTISYAINILYFKQNVQALLGIVSVPTGNIREVALGMELILGFAISITYLLKRIIDRDYKNILMQSLLAPLFFFTFALLIINPYALGNITDLDEWSEAAINFSKEHILVIITMLFLTLTCSIIFRNVKDKKYLHCFLASMALVCLIDYLYARDYGNFARWKLPLHICNTGVFLMFVSFTIKSKPIFYFNYLINIVGALFAIMMPDCEEPLFSQLGLHFWENHVILFILPIVAVAGGFYERPKIKFVSYSTLVFIAYFLTVGFLDAVWQDDVNFFFLNGDSIVDKFTWAPTIKYDHVITFDWLGLNFRIYWLYWTLVFVFYLGFISLAWFSFASLYQITDGYADLFNRSKEKAKEQNFLKKELGGRSVKEPLHPENKGRVVISHFSKIYEGTTNKAVDDFNLEIEPGTVYGFLGHNGAGKSTTIKSLVGIQTITEGSMEINGYDLNMQPLEAKMNIGYVSDNHTVYDNLTGREYINYVADLYLVDKKDRDERIDKYVKMFALEDAIDREIKGYSHGMKQKIVVIGSLIHNPKVWVLDEPLTGLDPTSSYQIKNIMKEYAEEGNIVFFSSHVIEVVEKICDKICIINQGKLIGTWVIKDLAKEGLTLQDLYLKYVSYKGGTNNA